MGLRARIFLCFGVAIALVIAAQWWLVSLLRSDLRAESAQSALEVGRSVLKSVPTVDAMSAVKLRPAQRSASRGSEDAELEIHYTGSMPMVPLRPAVPAQRIPVPSERLEAIGDQFRSRVILGSLGILALGLVAVAFLANRVTAPLRDLATAASSIGEGRFGTELPRVGERGLDATIEAFNRMSHRLRELETAARAQQAREHLTEIGEIARGLAHSLRNPLHAVGLTFQALAQPGSGSLDHDDVLAQGRAQVERIDRTLRLFLTMSTSAGGPVTEIDLVALAQDVVLETVQANPGVEIVVDAGKLRPMLSGIAAEVRAALHVLVVNAVEASTKGEFVQVAVGVEDDAVRFVVEDSGPGLAPEVRARLFQPHVTTKPQGAGFGLFLAERIASRRYRGSLHFEDRSPRGTRAVLRLRALDGGSDA